MDDENTLDLYYFGARYYRNLVEIRLLTDDPGIGRWMSVDPKCVNYPSISPYDYVANNPIRYIDIDGRLLYDKSGNRIELQQALVIISETISNFYSGN